MAWSSLVDNQMVSFYDIQEGGFVLKSGQSHVNSNQCITKDEALTKYVLDPTPLAPYASNQLIPKQPLSSSRYCCGDIFLPASNYTGEDLNYVYNDCETGDQIFITVYYNSGGETVYGRIPC
jgi:hypothetical protein